MPYEANMSAPCDKADYPMRMDKAVSAVDQPHAGDLRDQLYRQLTETYEIIDNLSSILEPVMRPDTAENCKDVEVSLDNVAPLTHYLHNVCSRVEGLQRRLRGIMGRLDV